MSSKRAGNALKSWTVCPGPSYGLNYVAHKNRAASLYPKIEEYLTIQIYELKPQTGDAETFLSRCIIENGICP